MPETQKDEMQKEFLNSMTETAANQKLVVAVPLKSENLANGSTVQEIEYKSIDGKKAACGFWAIRMRTAVLVTYESGSENDAAVPLIRDSVRNIEWIQPRAP